VAVDCPTEGFLASWVGVAFTVQELGSGWMLGDGVPPQAQWETFELGHLSSTCQVEVRYLLDEAWVGVSTAL
jgi:hypothetical protein